MNVLVQATKEWSLYYIMMTSDASVGEGERIVGIGKEREEEREGEDRDRNRGGGAGNGREGAGEEGCQHKIVYDGEYFCSKCGVVFNEPPYPPAGAKMEDIGMNSHGYTPIWQLGLGTLEGYTQGNDKNIRITSILSNIAIKLELTQAMTIEFYSLYRKFAKNANDTVYAAILAAICLCKDEMYRKRLQRLIERQSSGQQLASTSTNTSRLYEALEDIVYSSFSIEKKRRHANLLSSLSLSRVRKVAAKYGARSVMKAIEVV